MHISQNKLNSYEINSKKLHEPIILHIISKRPHARPFL